MTTLKAILDFWKGHGTKLLSFASGTIAAVAGVTGLIPESHLKYYMGAMAVLTFWRGFTNSNANPPA
jgi:hypothetical protein